MRGFYSLPRTCANTWKSQVRCIKKLLEIDNIKLYTVNRIMGNRSKDINHATYIAMVFIYEKNGKSTTVEQHKSKFIPLSSQVLSINCQKSHMKNSVFNPVFTYGEISCGCGNTFKLCKLPSDAHII